MPPARVLLLACCGAAALRPPLARTAATGRHARASAHMAAGGVGSASGGGGDLSGGSDKERNEQLDVLRSMFAKESSSESPADLTAAIAEPGAAEDASKLGLLLDLPLCRFSWCVLPHHQLTLNIWQPQYTLMFSSLLASPPPHYYLHVLLPGGAESLGADGFELQPGTKSSLAGTLMRVVYAQRQPDSRLTLVVQGLGRGVVIRPTQMLPYSRGDVQLLPDSESLIAAARASARWLRQLDRSSGSGSGSGSDGGSSMVGAAAGTAASLIPSVRRRRRRRRHASPP